MKTRQDPVHRKMGGNVSLDHHTLAMLDEAANAERTTRSALLRRIIAEWVADVALDRALMAEAEEILSDPATEWVPLEQLEAELGGTCHTKSK